MQASGGFVANGLEFGFVIAYRRTYNPDAFQGARKGSKTAVVIRGEGWFL